MPEGTEDLVGQWCSSPRASVLVGQGMEAEGRREAVWHVVGQGMGTEGRREAAWHAVRVGLGLRASWATSVLSSIQWGDEIRRLNDLLFV